MKEILMSIRPQWCEKIFNGSKTIEVRKSRPSIDMPFKVYVYQTKHKGGKAIVSEVLNSVYGGGKVIGEFVCDRITCCQAYYGESGEKHLTNLFWDEVKRTCLTEHEMFDYIVGKGKKEGTGWLWHITEPTLFEKPRDITEFALYGKCADECSEYDFCARDDEDDRVRDNCFKRTFLKRPPQAYCFIETNEN